MKNTNHKWLRMAIFITLSIGISNVFRFDIFNLQPDLHHLPHWYTILITVMLEGSGVFLAAMLVIPYLRKEQQVKTSLFGNSPTKSLIMGCIPLSLLTVIGVDNDAGWNPHFYGIIAGTSTLVYCIMEEYGWRGYMQEELREWTLWKKSLFIGSIWYLWHLTFLTTASFQASLLFWSMMVFGSWGIGQVAESTKSILASACFHMIIQIMMLNAFIKNGIDGIEKMVIFSISVGVWFAVIKKWEKEGQLNQTA